MVCYMYVLVVSNVNIKTSCASSPKLVLTSNVPLFSDLHCRFHRVYGESSVWSFQTWIRTTNGPSGALELS